MLKLDWMVLNRAEILQVVWVLNFRLESLWRETLAFKTDGGVNGVINVSALVLIGIR